MSECDDYEAKSEVFLWFLSGFIRDTTERESCCFQQCVYDSCVFSIDWRMTEQGYEFWPKMSQSIIITQQTVENHWTLDSVAAAVRWATPPACMWSHSIGSSIRWLCGISGSDCLPLRCKASRTWRNLDWVPLPRSSYNTQDKYTKWKAC